MSSDKLVSIGKGGLQQTRDEPRPTELRNVELFHSPDGEAYITVPIRGHRETYPLKSKALDLFLRHDFYTRRVIMKPAVVRQLKEELEAEALFGGLEHRVYTRLGGDESRIVLDLCNSARQAVEVTKDGWRVVDDSPVKFRRSENALALPEPIAGGSIDELRSFLSLKDDADFTLILGWLLGACKPWGPFPILMLTGAEGSTKSTATQLIRNLLDPYTGSLCSLPRSERDLHVAAANCCIQSFNNVSHIPAAAADWLCRLATEGGFRTRSMYSDRGESVFAGAKPIIVNGISSLVERSDLGSRTILIELPSRKSWISDRVFWRRFEEARPRILGALLTLVSTAIRHLPDAKSETTQRSADLEAWCDAAIEPLGSFAVASLANRLRVRATTMEDDVVPPALLEYLRRNGPFSGNATQLLEGVNSCVKERFAGWPRCPAELGKWLHRSAPAMRDAKGIDIRFRITNGDKVVEIRLSPKPADPADPAP